MTTKSRQLSYFTVNISKSSSRPILHMLLLCSKPFLERSALMFVLSNPLIDCDYSSTCSL